MNDYTRPSFLFNGHLETIYPALFRKILLPYHRERIETLDHDFLDLDWLNQSSPKLVIISHGLEGNSKRAYVTGMARSFFENGYDVLAWNYRGCSEEMNRQLCFYHSGATHDLSLVVNYAIAKGYKEINLIGFSLGGNLTLKYLGEQGTSVSPFIKKAITFSVPLHLHSSCLQISRPSNWLYASRFLISLKKKIIEKSKAFPELDTSKLKSINSLIDFDNTYTAPLHGFKDAIDYYSKCSSLYYLSDIRVRTLIINALNDPFLSSDCFPHEPLKSHPNLTFNSTNFGGHCGFTSFRENGVYWSEQKALSFITNYD